MKRNRNNFFPNNNAGGPNQYPNMMPPNEYMAPPYQNMTQPYQNYPPNVIPEQMGNYNGYLDESNFEARISRIERQIKKLNNRIAKLESNTDLLNEDDDISSSNNMYMI